MKLSKLTVVTLFLSLGLLTVNVSTALADSFSFDLNGSNLSGFSGPFVHVTVTTAATPSTTATITFTSLQATTGNVDCTVANPCTYRMGDGSTVALNVNATTFTVGTVTENGSFKQTNIGDQQVDGFSKFNLTVDNNDGFNQSATSVSFTITDTSGTFANAASVLTANANGAIAAAHIFVQSNLCDGACITGFAGGSGGTVPPTETPEPSALFLLGAGLIAVSALSRAKFRHR